MPSRGFIGIVALVAACSSTSAQPSKRPAPSDVVATVGDRSITLAEVDEKALQQPVSNFGSVRLAQALYEARRSAIDEIVAAALMEREAKALGVDRPTLVEKQITDTIAPVTDADVTAWYQANQSRVQNAPLDRVRAPIRAFLVQERMEAARQRYIGTLKAKSPVRVMLDAPRLSVSAASGPSKGPVGAPIEMIEFSDFQCPFCLRAHPTVDQVLTTYGDRIHFVYRHYPLPSHPNARPAAEASACAAEQNKFWPYHDRLFANPSKLAVDDLKRTAADIGLDAAKFDACVDSHKFKAQVDADVAAANEAGVDGTPAFFINGRAVNGAQPFDVFKRVIDEELETKGK